MSCDFETTTHGKWILAGEHAVLRGHPALVFPVHDKKLTLKYRASTAPLSFSYMGDKKIDMHGLFSKVLAHGLQLLGLPHDTICGEIQLESNIPIGVGMGASAALCVAIARWFVSLNLIPPQNTLNFAKELEHLFHGQSSGLDIAGVSTSGGIYFQQGNFTPLLQTWEPNWALSYCGEIGMTSPCIQQVQCLWQSDPALAIQIDEQMHESVLIAKSALENETSDSLLKLTQAINQALNCFQQWGLVSEPLQQHMQALRDQGAIAVKPTGSGGGGYVVGLWNSRLL